MGAINKVNGAKVTGPAAAAWLRCLHRHTLSLKIKLWQKFCTHVWRNICDSPACLVAFNGVVVVADEWHSRASRHMHWRNNCAGWDIQVQTKNQEEEEVKTQERERRQTHRESERVECARRGGGAASCLCKIKTPSWGCLGQNRFSLPLSLTRSARSSLFFTSTSSLSSFFAAYYFIFYTRMCASGLRKLVNVLWHFSIA